MSGAAETQQNSNEPKNSKFKQQQLPAWQPILTAGTVLPTFFVIGLAFVPIGVGLMYFSDQVNEVVVPYTDCKNAAGILCSKEIEEKPADSCECIMPVSKDDIGDKIWEGQVFIYYGLTNFYQNHRRYVKSRDDKQLYGDIKRTPNEDCKPFDAINGSEKYAPCGAIANSLFNDTIVLQWKNTAGAWEDVPLLRTGIAWDSDKKYKFQNPKNADGSEPKNKDELEKAFAGTVKPMDWQNEIWELDTVTADAEGNLINNGFQNEDLIVWMRTAALPNFRKLYRKVKHEETTDFEKGLPADKEYQLKISYNYPVTQFSGTKSVIIATTSILGGKNPFLGIAYIVVGCICFLIGIIFLFIHLKFGRTTQEMLNIGPNSQYNSS